MDRQGSGKKPLNYLTSTYGDTFRFEDAADGQNWVSLPGVEPVPAAEPSPALKVEDASAEAVETAASMVEVEDAVDAAEAVEAVQEPEPRIEPDAEPDPEEQGYVTPQEVTDKLVAGGFDPEIARQVTEIFADSTSYRGAYNKLRSVFGQ